MEQKNIELQSDQAPFKGLRLVAPSGVKVTLFSGFSGENAISPDRFVEKEGVCRYYFSSLTAGNFYFTAEGEGYYSVKQCLYLSEEKLSVLTSVSADPGKIAGRGFESSNVQIQLLTDEAMRRLTPSDPSLWPEIADAFTTPAFTSPHAAHEFTSQDEMMSFLKALDDTSLHAYRYTLAKSGCYGHDLPIVIFTSSDLSGAKNWEEAAKIVRENGKPTVQYHAQIHGNEPAAGEGALAMIQALYGTWGKELIKKINLYVIPRVNPDGSQAFVRNEVKQDKNMNRDMLTAETAEIRALLRAKNLFQPEMVIDAHEYTKSCVVSTGNYHDVLMSVGGGVNNGAAPREMSVEFFKRAAAALSARAFRSFAYPIRHAAVKCNTVNAANPATGRLYNSLDGALSFLVESRGIKDGRQTFARRVAAQVITIRSLLNSAAENAERMQKIVAEERERIIRAGKIYDENRVFSLQSEPSLSVENSFLMQKPVLDFAAGEVLSAPEEPVYYIDAVLRSRPFPTAYVLPKGKVREEKVLATAALHGIAFYELEPGSAVLLQQYGGTAEKAALSEEKTVAFDEGAYVFPMNQKSAVILALLMEPDIRDAKEGAASFAQAGVIAPVDGAFPLYRYIHDLEEDGTISFFRA